ncbi:aminodeoxychorismate synthase component I [Anaerotalea alkaliphila]|uniref:aminodeoxychorismate synthase n=1 Tax=Anaerotalea alkaliphila TaxID=2662126 RepID=A0A7X5KLC1_9FIRM|nr:aminodeoxychorismate synthase component I [Anaerotalea alkaliphila]NDL66544.1 aminodeoxychorismate synthase component I [Anaerotalea alkaliphila]
MREPRIEEFHTSLEPDAVYGALAGREVIFLDSAREGELGRFSIIGLHPFQRLQVREGRVLLEDAQGNASVLGGDVFQELQKLLEMHPLEPVEGLPLAGGALGYFAYDLSGEMEQGLPPSRSLVEIPQAYWVFYDNLVVMDRREKRTWLTAMGVLADPAESIDGIGKILKAREAGKSGEGKEWTEGGGTFTSPFTPEAYMEAVDRMRSYILDGHIYIGNLTHTFRGSYAGDPFAAYRRLRSFNSAPFGAFLPLEGFAVLSSSPERFLEIRQGRVETRPIKGTRPRGRTPGEDQENRKALEESGKDRSELLMIVDLERNDLSKVCRPGSVEVKDLFTIESYATVHHLVAGVTGLLEEGKSPLDCVRACFPGGSITGAPKRRAMEIIAELERHQRGLYTGCIGYLGFDGSVDLNIAIRTILLKDGQAYLGVGGGVTWESDPAAEYQETLDKAAALFKTLEAKEEEPHVDHQR